MFISVSCRIVDTKFESSHYYILHLRCRCEIKQLHRSLGAEYNYLFHSRTYVTLRPYLTGGDVAATTATDQSRRLGRPKIVCALTKAETSHSGPGRAQNWTKLSDGLSYNYIMYEFDEIGLKFKNRQLSRNCHNKILDNNIL